MAEKILETSQGKVKVNEENKIVFPNGIYAFEDLKNFYILQMDDENVFQLLQSEDKQEIAFIIVNPYLFKKDYVLNIREEDLKEIGIKDSQCAEKSLSVYAIVTVTESSMTANLLGPLVINMDQKSGKQALALNEEYSTKHDILEELNANENNKMSEAIGVSVG